ncbi:DUF4387 family protein [Primorskyibacter sp. S187A]|uniref:DUF4387 family protein n=1 Tax=Primorskyibacter sp. S187A TaxID=3415130 RepID=UPI003C7E5DA6
MSALKDHVQSLRSKNAGPFWLTIDIFCGSREAFETVSAQLITADVAQRLQTSEASLKRFDIVDLHVIKFSLPRPAIQGTAADRDMHGASFTHVLAELEI